MNLRFFPLLLLTVTLARAMLPSQLPSRVKEYAQGKDGGVAAAWVDADGPQFFAVGNYSAADPRKITADTFFEIGSVTKVFTSLLLAEAEHEGKVSRLDPAAKFLIPSNDPAQKTLAPITLLSLSTHSSGLPRLPSNLKLVPGDQNPYAAYDLGALVSALRTDGAIARPGVATAYSNFGACVLGEALAAALGTTYADALRAKMLTPLGLQHTSLGLTGEPAPADLAPPHVAGKEVPAWTFLACAAAGGLRSSAREMATFVATCLHPESSKLRAAIDATLVPQRDADDVGGKIALGWFVTTAPGHEVYWHNGATAGSRTFVGFDRLTNRGVVLLANNPASLDELGFALLDVLPPHSKPAAVKDAASFEGRYPLTRTFAIDIRQRDGALYALATGQSQLALKPLALDRFTVVGVPAEISFQRDASGAVSGLTLHQNGRDQAAPRSPLPPTVQLPEATLAEYVGSYPLAPSFVLTVTLSGGTLSAQATAQPALPIYATAKDEFFYTAVDAQISFQRDVQGKVTSLVLHQNGRDLPAQKSAN